MVVPRHLRLLFWDTNLDVFDPTMYPAYTIARVLEYGDEQAIEWLRGAFSRDQIREVVRTNRSLTRLSANFWALILGVPAHDVAALRASP